MQRHRRCGLLPATCRGADKGGVSLFQKEIPLPYTLPEKICIASVQLEELRRLPIATCCARQSRVERYYTICLCSYYPLLRSRWRLCALRMRHTPCGCRSAHLVEVQTNLLLPTMHTVSIMRTAASEAMPLRQAIPGLIESEVERSYVRVMNRRQSDSEDRSKSNRLDIKQGRHLIRQALQFFELLACNGGVKGQGPLRSLGGPRGIFSHVREYPPFPVQRLRRCFPPPRNARKNIKKSTLTGALFQIAEN